MGAAVIGGVEVRITPKVPVDRVFFLLGYARRPRGWRQEEVHAGEHPELLPALAHAYALAADRALRRGVLQGYREMEEALPVVRGRIREADQLRRRYGLPLPVEVRYDDYTVDIAENRLLLAASIRLLRLPDLVHYAIDSTGREVPAAVLDSKYKVSADGADLYQMLAYCTALGLGRGHLVYATGEPYRHAVRGTGIEITQHAIDLTLPPSELLGSVERLAESIVGLGIPDPTHQPVIPGR
ncbi:5-methylcytosine restriction system specificity protein McrC [Streptosporangium sp. NPDC001682]